MKKLHQILKQGRFSIFLYFIPGLIFLTSCAPTYNISQEKTFTDVFDETSVPSNTSEPEYTASPTITSTATITHTATISSSITPTLTETVAADADWIWYEPEESIFVPILLYHHIETDPEEDSYYLSEERFLEQLDWLQNNGFESILPEDLIEVFENGGKLPPKPVIITFDDGDLDTYETAFPILESYGYKAALYVVYHFIDTSDYMSIDQIIEIKNAGWEIGSHSMTHLNLTVIETDINLEMYQSKVLLEELLGFEINTFAYPFGAVNELVIKKSQQYGYSAAMGLGIDYMQEKYKLFYLNRLPIDNTLDMERFTELLSK